MSEAVVLPIGRTQFFDNNGRPLAMGKVWYYVPNTTTDKNTWQDPGKSVLNTNPVELDASGCAFVFGDGDYRMVVKSSTGVQIFDGYTEGVVAGTVNPTGGFGEQESITAAAETDLGSIASHNALITGATGIGSFGDSASLDAPIYFCEVDTGFSLLASADLLIPGGIDRALEARDCFLVEYLGTGQWQVIAIWPSRGLNTGFGPQGALVAAATTSLGTINSNFVSITGNTGITSFGNAASLLRPVFVTRFTGTPLLTHSANLVLPNAANIQAAAGDIAAWQFLGAGAWRLLWYVRANGLPLVAYNYFSQGYFSDTPGAIDYTIPAGVTATTRIKFTLKAGGGGGGGSNAGNTNGGSGGGEGAYWEGYIYGFVSGQHITGTVGAAGAGGTDNAGAAGGLSKITYGGHDLVACSGGGGGARSGGAVGAGGTVTKDITGVTLLTELSVDGQAGEAGGYAGSDVNWSGAGGGEAGGAVVLSASGGAGLAGKAAGGRGNGGSGSVGAAGLTGGAGSKGFIKIEFMTQEVA